jgi:hypothetical protein
MKTYKVLLQEGTLETDKAIKRTEGFISELNKHLLKMRAVGLTFTTRDELNQITNVDYAVAYLKSYLFKDVDLQTVFNDYEERFYEIVEANNIDIDVITKGLRAFGFEPWNGVAYDANLGEFAIADGYTDTLMTQFSIYGDTAVAKQALAIQYADKVKELYEFIKTNHLAMGVSRPNIHNYNRLGGSTTSVVNDELVYDTSIANL